MSEAVTFLGQPPAVWSAFAALGSLATAVVLAGVNYRLSGARPKLKVELAAIDSGGALHRMRPRGFKRRNKFPENALECVAVTVENRGRTPLTIDAPVFDVRYSLYRPKAWWRAATFRTSTIGTRPITWPGFTCEDGARLEVGGRLRYLLQVGPVMRNPHDKTQHKKAVKGSTERRAPVTLVRDWDYTRMRVVTAGKRDKVARWVRIPASPKRAQFSGEPETFRQFVTRWLILDALLHESDERKPGDDPHSILLTDGLANALVKLFEGDEPFTWATATEALKPFRPNSAGTLALQLGWALRDSDFVNTEKYLSDSPGAGKIPGN